MRVELTGVSAIGNQGNQATSAVSNSLVSCLSNWMARPQRNPATPQTLTTRAAPMPLDPIAKRPFAKNRYELGGNTVLRSIVTVALQRAPSPYIPSSSVRQFHKTSDSLWETLKSPSHAGSQLITAFAFKVPQSASLKFRAGAPGARQLHIISSLTIQESGPIKVRLLNKGVRHKAGTLTVRIAEKSELEQMPNALVS